MRSVCCAAGMALLACNIAGFAETKIPCSQTMIHALQSRAVLIIDSRPAGLQIVGTDQEAIHVSCTASSDETVRDVALHFSPTPNGGRLSIKGAHLRHGNNNLEVKIEVPRRTNLSVRMFAGEVSVKEVKGDKDNRPRSGTDHDLLHSRRGLPQRERFRQRRRSPGTGLRYRQRRLLPEL